MNRTLKSALIELRGDGVELDPISDLEHILTLDRLSRNISSIKKMPGDDAILAPVLRVGNITLRHLSLGARRFMLDVVAGWFPNDIQTQDLAYAYCMAVGHEPERLWAIQHSRREFKSAITQWEKTVGTPIRELKAAIVEFVNTPDPTDTPREPGLGDYKRAAATLQRLVKMPQEYADQVSMAITAMETEQDNAGEPVAPYIEALIQEYGHDAEYWTWRISERELDAIMAARRERKDAEAREIQGSRDDRFQSAHHAFKAYLGQLRRTKKGQKK